MNDADNIAYALEAPDFGRLSQPTLFIHGEWDIVCQTISGNLATPMRQDCADLTEVTMEAGHFVMLERPDETNVAIAGWLLAKNLG